MDKPLKILVVTQYFWPENMRINSMVEGFIAKGHEVTVLTGQPNYPEGQIYSDYRNAPDTYSNYFGANILRVPIFPRGCRSATLAFNYVSFFCSASIIGAFKTRNKHFDVIFFYAVSPIMAAIPALIIGRLKRCPVFIWILDLWPESLSAVGAIKSKRALALVGKLVSWIYNRADYLLLQSKSFEENIKKYCTKHMNPERLIYFPSWAEDNFSSEPSTSSDILERDDSTFTIVFAGNIGEAQDFPTILCAVEALKNELPLRWVIVGDGRASNWLHEQVAARGLKNVLLLGRHSLEKMPPLFAAADALLVSLKTNEAFEKTIPGKVQAYLASGKPILAMIEGEAARVIEDAGAGMTCNSGDANGLANIVRSIAVLSPSQYKMMGDSGRRYYVEHFSKNKLFDRLEKLFYAARLRRNDRR